MYLERRAPWQWGAFFFCLVLAAVLCAYWKPLTSDEMFTFEIARQGSIADVWRALRAGADFHPPLDFLARHVSMALFGQSEIAFRLPSMLAMWAALGCIYSFVARRTSALYGLIAALIPLSMPVFEYAYEARAYAFMFAFSAAALVAWQRRTEGSRVALLFLAASLGALVWSHWYGVLTLVALGVGELVRTWERRRVDWGAWAALAMGGAALLPLLPFVLTAREIGAVHWTKVGVPQALAIYSGLLERLCIAAVVVMGVLLATGWSNRARGAGRRARSYEIAAVLGLVVMPLLAYVLAKSLTGALVTRYVLPTAIGLTAALAFAMWEAFGATAVPGVVVAATLALSASGDQLMLARKQRQIRAEFDRARLANIVRDVTLPIVMTDNDLLMQLWHYEPPDVVKRLVYLADAKAAVEFAGSNTLEMLFPRLEPFSDRVNVEPYRDFVQKNRRFLLIDRTPSYVVDMLLREGAIFTARTPYRGEWLFHVELPGQPAVGQ